jgi:N-glycosylase/DNA lyase
LRLLNQDFEQTLLSFTLASVKSISSIRQSIKLLSRKFGDKIEVNGKPFYLFPRTEVLAQASDSELKQTKIGFRSKYLRAAAKFLLNNLPGSEKFNSKKLDSEQNASQQEIIDRLTSIHGVGDKIADCVMCYSLGYDNITPMDVWGKRYLVEYYGLDPKMKYQQMRNWVESYFGQYGAWAGQFLFEYIRENYR